MFQHPLHKRVISRVTFYGGVFLFLWLLDHAKAAESHQGKEAGLDCPSCLAQFP